MQHRVIHRYLLHDAPPPLDRQQLDIAPALVITAAPPDFAPGFDTFAFPFSLFLF